MKKIGNPRPNDIAKPDPISGKKIINILKYFKKYIMR
jgi:hypothetical protein